jgi:Uma2 family endonuclease
MVTLAKWSVEDYHRMIEAGILCARRVELIAGEIVEMSPEGPLHTSINIRAVNYLRSLLAELAEVREAHPITLTDSEPEPDIAVVRLPQQQYFQHHPYPEDIFWLIEVSDTTLADDLSRKKRIYAQAGIQEYWVLDVNAQKLMVFREPEGNNYRSEFEYSQGTITPLAFPDVQISVERLCQRS